MLKILTERRPHGSSGEKAWVNREIVERYRALATSCKEHDYEVLLKGPMENVVVYCDMRKNPDTLFSCHTDTVHAKDGRQQVLWDTVMGVAYKKDGDPLGADDGTGVWILMQMLAAGIPGTYVFHRGEERGCIGSRWMKENEQPWLKSYKHAIAFDRRDTTHVITHQRGSECCSSAFAAALAEALNTEAKKLGYEFDYKPDSTGVYTDTANYAGLIPECTNLSIGYEGAHGGSEIQNLEHVQQLVEVAKAIDWKGLPALRVPKDPYEYRYNGYYSGWGSAPRTASGFLSLDYEDVYGRPLPWASRFKGNPNRKAAKRYRVAQDELEQVQAVVLGPPEDLHELDLLVRSDRLAFARCFPEQMDAFVEQLLKLRRKVITARLVALKEGPPAATPVVNSPAAGPQGPADESGFYYDW